MPRHPADRDEDNGAGTVDIREQILDRTIYLMGKAGTTDVSVRAIAREAGVNLAAVNYYFTTKEQMLAQLADRFRGGFDEVMRLLDDQSAPPEQRLRRWAAEVMRYLSEYPGMLTLMERQMAAEPLDQFGETLRATMELAVHRLEETLKQIVVGDERRLSFKLTLLVSTLAGPFPRGGEGGLELRTSTQRTGFLDLLLEHLRH